MSASAHRPEHPGEPADRDRCVAAEIDEELAFHLDAATADGRAAGLNEAEANAAAARAFGEVSRHRDACLRVAYGSTMMRKKWAIGLAAVLILASGYVAGLATPELLRELDGGSDWARIGAFEGLEWRGDTPLVLVDDRWWVLEKIHGRDVEEVLAHSEAVYEQRGRERFSEDLFEVLKSMGLPGETLDATLRDPAIGRVETRRGLEMNEEARNSAKRGLWKLREGVPMPPTAI
ncbi:MAG: permease prefix domain 1-containing protein [Planctomycetota bacterium]